jgi:predicted dehydrogenase
MGIVRIGIVGAGNISEAHLDGYRQLADVEVVAICDIDAEKLAAYAKAHGIPKTFTDYREMLKLPELDAISVCVWNCEHAAVTIAALRAGKHVLCEKPLAMSVAEAKQMEEEARIANRTLSVGVVMRFDQRTKVVQDMIEADRFGKLYFARATDLRRVGSPLGWFSSKALSGGGPMIDLGVHIIDICRYFMGNPKPVAISAATFEGLGAGKNIKGLSRYYASGPTDVYDVEDLAVALIRFDNGALLEVETSYTLHAEQEEEYTVKLYGTKGSFTYEPRLNIFTTMDDYLVDISPRLTGYEDDSFRREIAHFVDCVRGDAKSIAPAADGVEMMKILCGVYESAKLGREVLL